MTEGGDRFGGPKEAPKSLPVRSRLLRKDETAMTTKKTETPKTEPLTITAWVNELHRLLQILTPDHAEPNVALDQVPWGKSAYQERQRMQWRARFVYGPYSGDHNEITAPTPEAAAQGLIDLLQKEVAKKLTAAKAELSRLERATGGVK